MYWINERMMKMNIAFTYKDWFNMHEDDFDYSVTHRGMKGLRDIEDEKESIVFYYPEPFVDELKELPYDAVTLTFALYRTDYYEHAETIDLKFDVNECYVHIYVEFDHLGRRIDRRAFVPTRVNPFSSIQEYIAFKQTIYQKIESYMRENSPDRLTIVTNTYEYRGELPFKEGDLLYNYTHV
mgnify:CR=1 FL=1